MKIIMRQDIGFGGGVGGGIGGWAGGHVGRRAVKSGGCQRLVGRWFRGTGLAMAEAVLGGWACRVCCRVAVRFGAGMVGNEPMNLTVNLTFECRVQT